MLGWLGNRHRPGLAGPHLPNNRQAAEERVVGTRLWPYEAPWRPESGEALFALQAHFVAESNL